MWSEYNLLVYMLIFDAIMGVTVPLEFIIHEIRYRRDLRERAVNAASPVPQRPSLRWPLLVILCAGLASTFAFVIYLHRPQNPPAPTGHFGFAPVQQQIPSKPYSPKEKRELSDLIGTISILLNNKGFPAAQIGRVSGSSISTTKEGLDDSIKRADSVQTSLSQIQREIWNNIIPNNPNYAADLNYIIDSNAKLDSFQRATDRFSGQIINFERKLGSLDQDTRNWISSLIAMGSGQLWSQAADNFQAWIQQCNTRIDAEQKALK